MVSISQKNRGAEQLKDGYEVAVVRMSHIQFSGYPIPILPLSFPNLSKSLCVRHFASLYPPRYADPMKRSKSEIVSASRKYHR